MASGEEERMDGEGYCGKEMEGIVPVAKNGSERGNDFCGQ